MGKKITYVFTDTTSQYGFFHLLFDFLLTILTCGLWLVWILIRYLRRNTY